MLALMKQRRQRDASRSDVDVQALQEALERLEAASPELARLVERRYFAGLTLEQIAELDGASLATVKRRWRAARAWLHDALGGAPPAG